MESDSHRIQERSLDGFIMESYTQMLNSIQILDAAMNSPYVDLTTNKIVPSPSDKNIHVETIEPLIMAYCLDFSFGDKWPTGGLEDTSTTKMINITNELELYNYLTGQE